MLYEIYSYKKILNIYRPAIFRLHQANMEKEFSRKEYARAS